MSLHQVTEIPTVLPYFETQRKQRRMIFTGTEPHRIDETAATAFVFAHCVFLNTSRQHKDATAPAPSFLNCSNLFMCSHMNAYVEHDASTRQTALIRASAALNSSRLFVWMVWACPSIQNQQLNH